VIGQTSLTAGTSAVGAVTALLGLSQFYNHPWEYPPTKIRELTIAQDAGLNENKFHFLVCSGV
jgi:hypothetical protein